MYSISLNQKKKLRKRKGSEDIQANRTRAESPLCLAVEGILTQTRPSPTHPSPVHQILPATWSLVSQMHFLPGSTHLYPFWPLLSSNSDKKGYKPFPTRHGVSGLYASTTPVSARGVFR